MNDREMLIFVSIGTPIVIALNVVLALTFEFIRGVL